MKSVEIPCCFADEDENVRLTVDKCRGSLELWVHEDDECCLVFLDREGVEKLIAAAQEWLEETK